MSDSQTSSNSRSQPGKDTFSASMPEMLAMHFPPLETYCPILPEINKQQALFLLLECEEALYGGAVGGGKTAALLMGAIQYVDVPGYAALILRRTFPELEQPEGPIWQSLKWFGTVDESIRPVYAKAERTWTFPSGAVIRFGHLDDANAVMRYQGGGYHYVGFDELTHFEQSSYEFVAFSRQRKPPKGPLSEVPMRVRSSANPGGPGHIWVKKRFIDDRPADVAFIPAKVWDNPGIDTDDYVSRLQKLSPVLQEQLLNGDWGAFEGAAFEQFDEAIHCVDIDEIPEAWERFESMDHGISAPTAWHAWAIDHDANHLVFDSYYSPGLPSEHAPVILGRRQTWGSEVCYGDPQSLATRTGGQRRWGEAATILTEYLDNGIALTPANNNPLTGYARLRELIAPDPERRFPDWHPRRGEMGSPRLFIVKRRCPQLVEQLLTAPLEPIEKRFGGEKIDGDWERRHGHALAACRYGAMSRPGPSDVPEVPPDDPRTIAMLEYERKQRDGGIDRSRYVNA